MEQSRSPLSQYLRSHSPQVNRFPKTQACERNGLMSDLVAVDRLPDICGSEDVAEAAIAGAAGRPMAFGDSRIDFARVRSAFAIALHMHQPLIPRAAAIFEPPRSSPIS